MLQLHGHEQTHGGPPPDDIGQSAARARREHGAVQEVRVPQAGQPVLAAAQGGARGRPGHRPHRGAREERRGGHGAGRPAGRGRPLGRGPAGAGGRCHNRQRRARARRVGRGNDQRHRHRRGRRGCRWRVGVVRGLLGQPGVHGAAPLLPRQRLRVLRHAHRPEQGHRRVSLSALPSRHHHAGQADGASRRQPRGPGARRGASGADSQSLRCAHEYVI
mmetsp:Transcript_36536/g.97865  ORF Transcript_36536/g.97865 Transcript_36536/m.97865 type:complete len:218 (+) Transcript_36536:356-1009(+)